MSDFAVQVSEDEKLGKFIVISARDADVNDAMAISKLLGVLID